VPGSVKQLDIEARLVSATEDFYPHPNKCSGKFCNQNGVYRRSLKRSENTDFNLTYVATFIQMF